MQNFFRMLSYVGRYKAGLALSFVLALLGMGFELLRPWPVKVVVDYTLTDAARPEWLTTLTTYLPGAQSQTGLLIWSVAALAVVAIGAAAMTFIGMSVTVGICYRMVYDLARDLFAKLQRLSMAYHQRQSVGDLLQRMSGDVFVVHYVVSGVVLPVVISLLNLVGMFVIMMLLDPVLAGASLWIVPALAASLIFFARPMDRATSARYERQASLMSLVEQSLSGMKIIQGFAREAYLQTRMERGAEELGSAYNRDVRIGAAYQQMTIVITGLGTAVVLGLGAWRVQTGHLSLGDLLVFLGYLAALYGPVSAVSLAVGAAVTSNAHARRVFDVLDCDEVIRESPDPVAVTALRGEIAFENVSFGYREASANGDQRYVLRDVTFTAKPGEVVAVVGATGVGKSSLIALLSRFYDPWEGRVLIDGHDVRDLPLRALRESIALVLQEPYLFPISVADNIAFGLKDVSRERIEAVARTAKAHDFIVKLPEGYDTVIGEKGSTLSGGERQRIAIARALIRSSPILVLDEPTSAVDARTEAEILGALAESNRHRTTFIVSHRLSTIRRADQIIVLDQGRIVEHGRHDELIADGEVYPHLYRHQELAML